MRRNGGPQTTALDTQEMREQAQEGISKSEQLSNLTIPGNKAESVEGNTMLELNDWPLRDLLA